MNYWLICLPREDLQHCIETGVFGLSRKHVMGTVKVGDMVVCCAGKGGWKVIALGRTTSDYYVDDKKHFLKEGTFPDRFDFKATMMNDEVDLISLLDQLSFVTKIEYWSAYFRNGIVKITKDDWNIFQKNSKPHHQEA